MLRSVFTKTIWDRRRSIMWWVIGTLAMTAWLLAFFPVIRDSEEMRAFVEDFPPELLTLVGIDPAVYQTGFGYLQAQLYSFIGPIIIIAFTIGIGAAATAREEENGTADLLLSTPVRRRWVVTDVGEAMVVLTGIILAAMAAVLVIANPLLDLKLSIVGIVGINMGLLLLGLFFGAFAMLVGAWSGKRALAAGAAAALAIVAFFWNGLAPLINGLESTDVLSPFNWYLRDDPLLDGPTPWFLLLAAGFIIFVAAAAHAFSRRQIGVDPPFLGVRVPTRPSAVASRIRSPSLLSNIYSKSIWDRRATIWVWIGGLLALTTITIAFYPTIRGGTAGAEDAMQALIDSVPREMLAMFGITDPSALFTGAGFISSRVYSSIGIVIVLALAISMGAGATAREETKGTADLLLATPVTRGSVVMQKFGSMATLLAVVVTALLITVAIGDTAVDLGLTAHGLVAANLGLGLLALLFGSLAMLIGAWTGKAGAAIGSAAAAAILSFFVNGLGSAVDWLSPFRPFSPFFWYQGDAVPLNRAITPWLLVLTVVSLALALGAAGLFRRRHIGT